MLACKESTVLNSERLNIIQNYSWMEIMGRGEGDCCGQDEMEESC
jgi:hypothetical protein